VIDCLHVITWVIAFLILKPLCLKPILGLPIYLVVNSQNPLEARSEDLHARRTSDVIISNNWRPSSTMRKLKMKSWTSSRLLGIEDMKRLLAWVFDCHMIFEPIIPWSSFHLWLSKTFNAYSMVFIIPSIFSFWSYQILSFVLSF
jgi:hypothetical protein